MLKTGRSVVLWLILLSTVSGTAAGATLNWTGTNSGNWSDAGNWSPAAVPQNGDILVFPDTATQKSLMNDLTGLEVGGLQFLDNYTLDGYEITLGGDLYFHPYLTHFTCNVALTLATDVQIGNFSGAGVFTEAIDVNGHTLTVGTTNAHFNAPLNGSGTVRVTAFLALSGGDFSGTVTNLPSNGYTARLSVAGSMPNTTVASLILSGDGTVGHALGAEVDPGTNAFGTGGGVTGTLHIIDAGTYIDGYDVDVFPGGGSDLVRVAGSISLLYHIRIAMPAGAPAVGESFEILDNDGAGSMQGGLVSEGGIIDAGIAQFRVTYRGGDGNDVVITRIASPLTWTGAVSGLWSNPNNWSPAQVPANGADLTLPDSAENKAMSNDLAALQVSAIHVKGDSYSIGGNPFILNDRLDGFGARTLTLGTNIAIGDTLTLSGLVVQGPGTVDVNGHTISASSAFTPSGINTEITGSGVIFVPAALSHSKLTIGGSGSFSGTVNAPGAPVEIDGSLPQASVTAASLFGTGTIGDVTITASDRLEPGTPTIHTFTPAVLHMKSLTLAGEYDADLYPGGTSGETQVTGTVQLSGPLHVALAGGTLAPGQSFTIIDNDGTDPVSGTFVNLPEGGVVDVPPSRVQVSYHGGDGNDVVLTVVSTPTTTTTVTFDPPNPVYGQPTNVVATVSSSGGIPTGTITFQEHFFSEGYSTDVIGTAQLQNGVATIPMPWRFMENACSGYGPLFSAVYSGSTAFVASTSSRVPPNIRQTTTTISLTSSKPQAAPGESVTFTAKVTAAPPSQPSPFPGFLRIYVADPSGNEKSVASGEVSADGTLVYTTSFTAGTYGISAFYGYSNACGFLQSSEAKLTETVAQPQSSIGVHSSHNPSASGEEVDLTVTVSGNSPSGSVTLSENGTQLSQQTLSNGSATFSLTGLPAGDHQFLISYSGDSGNGASTKTFTQTVAPPAVSVQDIAVEEGSTNNTVSVPVQLSAPMQQPVTVNYATADGTATAGQDYIATNGTLTFAPGETQKSIDVTMIGDTVVEPDETFTVVLSQPNGASIDRAAGTVTIVNDDVAFNQMSFAYATAGGAQLTLNVAVPVARSGPFPVIVWAGGSRNYVPGGVSPALRETQRGYIVVVPTYRTPAQHVFPAQLDDLKAAVRWIRANAATLHADGTHIAVWGSGAGAHLAALLGTTGDSASAASLAEGAPTESNRVQAVIDWGGAADLEALDTDATINCAGSHNAATSPESQLIGCALAACPAQANAASPLTFVSTDDTAFLIMHGSADCVIPAQQSRKLYDALRAAGVPASLRIIDGIGASDAWWYSTAPNVDVDAFLDTYLHTASVVRRRAAHH
jgi:acetyl esterase/lipase